MCYRADRLLEITQMLAVLVCDDFPEVSFLLNEGVDERIAFLYGVWFGFWAGDR